MLNNLEVDWQKLDDFANVITKRIQKRMPNDWKLSFDEIKSEVNMAFVNLIRIYIPKENGRSITSYCYEYGEKIAFKTIMSEYAKLKKQVAFDTNFIEKFDNECYTRHIYGYYDELKTYTTIDKQLETHDIINHILDNCNELDKLIIQNIVLHDLSYRQISKKLNISQSLISKHLKKLNFL